MDSTSSAEFSTKKWFVYLSDHHEGPFSLADIENKMTDGQVSPATFVWAEGMTDWKLMAEVAAFEALVHPKRPSAPAIIASFPEPAREPAAGIPEAAILSEPTPIEEPAQGPAALSTPSEPLPEKLAIRRSRKWSVNKLGLIAVGVGMGGLSVAYLTGGLDRVLNSPALGAAGSAISDLGSPYLVKVVERSPALGKWISPIQALEDVSAEEYQELRAAATSSTGTGSESGGLRVAVALSRADLLTPSFYLATNLPDGASLSVFVEGIPDTLLNQLAFSAQTQASLTQKLGKTKGVRFNDGKPLPRGQYMLYVAESETQSPAVKAVLDTLPLAQTSAKVPTGFPKGAKLFLAKSFFLGGEKDSTYTQRLKEFHDKLRDTASKELADIKQFSGLIESQLATTSAQFTQLRKSRRVTPTNRAAWRKFHDKWIMLASEMNKSFDKWTPDTIQNVLFYGVLFQLTMQAGKAAERLHTFQDVYFNGRVDPKAFEIQLGEAESLAQTSLSALKAKIDQAEKIPPSPNGMPRRDGL